LPPENIIPATFKDVSQPKDRSEDQLGEYHPTATALCREQYFIGFIGLDESSRTAREVFASLTMVNDIIARLQEPSWTW
jgi:hypothetical protein